MDLALWGVGALAVPDEMGDLVPRPDPTTLTTSALNREIAAVRELFGIRVEALDRLVMDKLGTSESHRKEQKVDSDERIQAALTAAKDENAKTAASVAKQIDSLKDTFDSAISSLTVNLNDLKERVTKAEGSTGGQQQAKMNLYAFLSAVVAVIVIFGFIYAVRG
jgi:cobalamin biosynthesis Mg chelatase CobN